MTPPHESGTMPALETLTLTARPQSERYCSSEGFGPGYDLPESAQKEVGDINLLFSLKDPSTTSDGKKHFRILEVIVEEVIAVREIGMEDERSEVYDTKQLGVYHLDDKGRVAFSMLGDDCIGITSETPIVRDGLYKAMGNLDLKAVKNPIARKKLVAFYDRVTSERKDNVFPMPGVRLEEDNILNHVPKWENLLQRTTDYLQDKLFGMYAKTKGYDLSNPDTDMLEVHSGFYQSLGVLPFRADMQVKSKIARVLMDRLPLNAMVYDNKGHPNGFNESLYRKEMLEEAKQELLSPECQEALKK